MHSTPDVAIWILSAATIAAILLRPARIAEWIWAVLGAAVLVVAGLLPGAQAAAAALDGVNVYLFLAGMLTLAELARIHGVFDWLAMAVAPRAKSGGALFAWVFVAGILVTALLSNDGTIVLLTPAVLALTRRAALSPLPYLYACPFVASAASFILPISNPANLVVFRVLPALVPWLATFALASAAAVACSYAVLRGLLRASLRERVQDVREPVRLSRAGRAALLTVSISALALVAASALQWPLGPAAIVLAAAGTLIVTIVDRKTPRLILRQTTWSIVPLVAGLFVIVRALDRSGVLRYARTFFGHANALSHPAGSLLTGFVVAIADNVLNNLPAGVLVRYALQNHALDSHIAGAALIGIDLGPSLSLTGSLATLLWLVMLRRENIHVGPWQFFRLGVLVTVPSMALALLCLR